MADIKFEDALEKLDEIVADLEGGNLSLDDSLKVYEEGVKLIKLCTKKLNEAQEKIDILVKEEGKLTPKSFEEKE
jgi:exodeoxyribonuclease VII small subunit